MDISKLFERERLFPLDLRHPVSDEPLGIVFQIRSASSPEARAVERKHVDEIIERQQRGKLIKGDAAIKRELERVASFIAGWDWGPHEYKGEKPEFSFKRAAEIIEAEDWIFAQVSGAANKLENFMTGSDTKSAKP